MRHPKIVLGLYLVLAAIVCLAMGYVSMAAIRLDRAEAAAKAEAAQEKDIGLALWQMDTKLAPILAEEASRPYFEYLVPVPGDDDLPPETRSGGSAVLVRPPSDYVLLNFQWSPTRDWSSPQDLGHISSWALANGATNETMETAALRLAGLREKVSPETLLRQLPEQNLPRLVGSSYAENIDQQAVVDPIVSNYRDPVPTVPPGQSLAGPEPQQVATKGGGYQFEQRNTAMQSLAQAARVSKWQNSLQATPISVVEGTSSPVWIEGQLLLARRVAIQNEVVIQGCLLDWGRIQESLREAASEILPHFELRPVTGGEIVAGRFLASLPVEIVVPEALPNGKMRSTIPAALGLAWIGVLVGLTAGGGLLWGVVRLSERRARFVAAVSHELRTPLTTFRLYSEMLAGRMVTDADQQAEYHQTLHREAERLTHLVENVLAYSRLQRGHVSAKLRQVSIESIVDRVSHRLDQRCRDAGMKLTIGIDPSADGIQLDTDPEAVEQILFNLVDNACKYGRARSIEGEEEGGRVEIRLVRQGDRLAIQVIDDGPGVEPRQRRRMFQPFSKSVQQAAGSAPGIGLGLSLSRDLARSLGGNLEFSSAEGRGACLVLTLPCSRQG